ncbi:glycosyl transferase [Streptomyces kronopolitis]|uniref:Glycosyl transferase n=1 Tax=Streptomyces kronopolitis TaxID=1612435 RepID=A0ABQ2JDS6_9ACTN|nr:glycosyltransferase [Streptomyces kronopolitis]GGN43263.1 glycosyl transferase [Streptomyces kronopolitis]
MKPTAIAVLIPAHNEEELLPRALAAVHAATRHPALAEVRVMTVVAADACVDHTEKVAGEQGASVLHLGAQNPGKARAAAAHYAMASLGTSAGAIWLASTDADSAVPPDWLAFQLDQAHAGWEAVIGTVTVTRWPRVHQLADRHHQLYNASRPAGGGPWRHPHVHGANLGVAAEAYQKIGGFPALPVGEDLALVNALERNGHRVLRTSDCPVETSSRLRPRAVGGFGDHLARLAAQDGVLR